MMKRQPWDEYFMGIAREVSTHGTCDRKRVGCLLVVDRRIVATGYNGALSGQPHCDDAGHLMEDGHCVRTMHAESNAVAQAAKHGIRLDGSTCYTTASPCWPCFRLLASAGIRRIVAGEFYRDQRSFDVARDMGIEIVIPGGA